MRNLTLTALAVIALGLAGCERKPTSVLIPNLRPSLELSTAPLPGDSVFYLVRFNWFAFDPDGAVARFEYVVDPPALGDTAWTSIVARELTIPFRSSIPLPDPPPTGQVPSSEFHVFAIRAVDNEGAMSAVAFSAFTSFTVAPTTQILVPSPSHLITVQTAPTLRIRWNGTDPDGLHGKLPLKYKFRLVPLVRIQGDLGLSPNARPDGGQLQEYLLRDAPEFATWDSTPADSPFVNYETLPQGLTQYFAVTAIDEAGAYEPRFSLDRNVLVFRALSSLESPRLTVSNDYFTYTATSFNLDEERVGRLAIPLGGSVRFDWNAVPPGGATIIGYRWVLDPINGDISDETPRGRDDETYRWSSWSVTDKSLTAGPYSTEDPHRLYIEARDNAGSTTIAVIEIRAIARTRDILLVDDFQGPPDKYFGPGDARNYQPWGAFPTEAVLDTLLVARGGVPYKFRPPGTLSKPGVFAGYDVDTLDYRFVQSLGVPLDVLLRYRVVVWYVGVADAVRLNPQAALRLINRTGYQNTLKQYLSLGGKVWLFGDGVVLAIGFGTYADASVLPHEPRPGEFLYEGLMLRSRFDSGGRNASGSDRLVGATSYLPEHRTPGTSWPPDTARVIARGPCDDPRVGPASARNSERWGGLPCLTVSTEYPDWPIGFPSSFASVMYVSKPLSIIEDLGDRHLASTLDTLYLYRATNHLPSPTLTNADGKPLMFSYWGQAHGPVVWTALPLWYFERTELQQIAERVMTNFGIAKNPNPSTWTGPGSAHWELGAPGGPAAPVAHTMPPGPRSAVLPP